MALNNPLHAARKNRNDEFYTQIEDIALELEHYPDHFRGKTVYCNCDDPSISAFYEFFALQFGDKGLGIRKLITTCYKNQQRDLFSQHDCEQAIKLEYNGPPRDNPSPSLNDIGVTYLKEDGDFRSQECIELLKHADIVVTNPPFSLFREYVAQLAEYEKKFIIIGNKNAIAYKEIFSLIKENKLWIGYSSMSKDLLFDVPHDYAKELLATKKEGSAYKIIDGVVKGRSQSVWFTNLEHKKRNEELILYKRYTPEDYPTYDNYDAIEVSRTVEIPMDYSGVMGVPVTFLDKYNPDQFEIIGLSASAGYNKDIVGIPFVGDGRDARAMINNKVCYARVLIRNKKQKDNNEN